MYYNPFAWENLAHQRIVKNMNWGIKIQEEWTTILKLLPIYLMVTENNYFFFFKNNEAES